MRGTEESIRRTLDANFNRAGEALRVVEDVFRFHLDDGDLARRAKELRHSLAALRSALPADAAARDSAGDVGRGVTVDSEAERSSVRGLLAANFRRLAESLRVIEETLKLPGMRGSAEAKRLRYAGYDLEREGAAALRPEWLEAARLMVLYDPLVHPMRPAEAAAALDGLEGVCVQLRSKGAGGRRLLELARECRDAFGAARVPLVVNDRPDVALLAGADGVHLGAEDVPAAEARRIVGPSSAIGVSTHTEADLDSLPPEADYIGAGPCAPSATKGFASSALAGPAFAALASERAAVPVFAIGGVDVPLLERLVEKGVRRAAVCAAAWRDGRLRENASALLRVLEAAW
ncbi:MAG: hypothetical protein DRP90_00095 [Planctomycetota bacterium]|nr:MAG: hypothetical protein DRP90_00095 [Planctomycetota bacterium]